MLTDAHTGNQSYGALCLKFIGGSDLLSSSQKDSRYIICTAGIPQAFACTSASTWVFDERSQSPRFGWRVIVIHKGKGGCTSKKEIPLRTSDSI